MTLLFTTRKIDKNDERVGFASGWLVEFSKHLTKLIVICQEKGDVSNLPDNIEVYSLGKERGKNKISQFFLLLYYFITLLPKANAVFSHMVPHFAVLAGPWCKIYHKKLVQWYVHKKVSPYLKLANFFVDEYVTTNEQSFRMKTKKTVHYFGHGIDVNKFKNQNSKIKIVNQNSKFIILSVSRISPSKNIDLIIKAVENILKKDIELKKKIELQIIGAPGLSEQQTYYESLIKYTADNNLSENIKFLGPLAPDKVLTYYQNCDLFINLSETGSVDKAVLEAMACEKLVLTSNESFKNIIPVKLFLTDKIPENIADKILELYHMPETEKIELQKILRQEVVENHNLEKLAKKIIKLYE